MWSDKETDAFCLYNQGLVAQRRHQGWAECQVLRPESQRQQNCFAGKCQGGPRQRNAVWNFLFRILRGDRIGEEVGLTIAGLADRLAAHASPEHKGHTKSGLWRRRDFSNHKKHA